MKNYPALFSPCRIWKKTISNRFVAQSMECNDGDNGSVSAIELEKYINLAKGNWGVTIYDISSELNSSAGTVSRVLNNSPVLDLLSIRIDTIELSVYKPGHEAAKYFERRIVQRDPKGIHQKIIGKYIKGTTI